MAATFTWMRDLPAAATGTMSIGMSFTICTGMSFSIVPRVTHSG